jgi:hypothetical protein
MTEILRRQTFTHALADARAWLAAQWLIEEE